MTTVRLKSLTKAFGDVKALEGLDLEVKDGELVSLLGPSGCGKTTALRLVAGFERPTEGEVILDDKDVSNVPPSKRNMGMVFQAYSLFPNMTAEENVGFGLRVRGEAKEKRSRRVGELLEMVGLSEAAGRYPHQLSGGMQQRVALARALAAEPEVLLLDEPLSALDAKVRSQLREEIRRIQTELGITTLFVTHDQEEALALSDRVAVLSEGRLEQVGTPPEIYGEPETPFVAEFIGTINRLEATVIGPGEVECEGRRLKVDVAEGYKEDDRVLVLVRPESVEISESDQNGLASGQMLEGRIVSRSFIGPVTRLRVLAKAGNAITADLLSREAHTMKIGDHVLASFDGEHARLLPLSDG
jgi:putative spermidine/putrescine transport system ATP-binding protein